MNATSQCVVLLVLCLQVLWAPSTDSARILGVWPMEAPSHFFLGNKLFKELAARGHEVTMISTFPQKTPLKNYRDIDLGSMKEAMNKLSSPDGSKVEIMNLTDIGLLPAWKQVMFTAFVGTTVTELALKTESVQRLLNDKNEKFDLIIFEMFHTEVLYGLAHKYNCPVVILSTIGSSVWTNHLVGNPAPSSYVPDLFLTFSGHMSLCDRIYNTLHNFLVEVYRKFYYFPQLDAKMHEFFKDTPSLEKLMYEKTAMILLNSHPSISDPKPRVPAMVEVGGFHVESAKPLPKDLKEFMDKAKDGVILFSMGSNLKSVDLTEDVRNHLLKTFSKLKQQVIWKWEDENLPGKPSNVKIMKWCPQNDIMAHPNLKVFITHGGLLSTTEAIYHGVPVLGIPIFGDQKMNVAMTVRKGYGVQVNYIELTEERLTTALNEILSNPKYRENAKKASQILLDQPVKPIDSAVFWINHVLKHKGADHFRSAAIDLEWYQLYSLDIVSIAVLINIAVLFVLYIVIKKLCCRKKECKKDMKKKKN